MLSYSVDFLSLWGEHRPVYGKPRKCNNMLPHVVFLCVCLWAVAHGFQPDLMHFSHVHMTSMTAMMQHSLHTHTHTHSLTQTQTRTHIHNTLTHTFTCTDTHTYEQT